MRLPVQHATSRASTRHAPDRGTARTQLHMQHKRPSERAISAIAVQCAPVASSQLQSWAAKVAAFAAARLQRQAPLLCAPKPQPPGSSWLPVLRPAGWPPSAGLPTAALLRFQQLLQSCFRLEKASLRHCLSAGTWVHWCACRACRRRSGRASAAAAVVAAGSALLEPCRSLPRACRTCLRHHVTCAGRHWAAGAAWCRHARCRVQGV